METEIELKTKKKHEGCFQSTADISKKQPQAQNIRNENKIMIIFVTQHDHIITSDITLLKIRLISLKNISKNPKWGLLLSGLWISFCNIV